MTLVIAIILMDMAGDFSTGSYIAVTLLWLLHLLFHVSMNIKIKG